jgi:hypothetical protein
MVRVGNDRTLAIFVPIPLTVAVVFSVSRDVGHSIRRETVVR